MIPFLPRSSRLRWRWLWPLIGPVVLFGLLLADSRNPVEGQEPEDRPSDRTVLMRQKLGHAQRILGGLAEGRLGPIEHSARALHEISKEAARYNLPTDDYRRFSAEFRRITAELADRAEAEDLEAATLLNVQLTINCVDCHKYVRIQRKAPDDPR